MNTSTFPLRVVPRGRSDRRAVEPAALLTLGEWIGRWASP